jgi:hypothetical protein
MRCYVLAFSSIFVAFASTPVRAQTPPFTTMDRGDAESRIGLDLGLTLLEDGAGNEATGFRFDFYGHFMAARRYGGYVVLPLSYVSFEDDAADEEMALGNIEVGGVYVVPVNRVAFVLRAGLTLPTASDGLAEFITNVLAVRPRGTDAVTVTPQSLWLRSAASVVGRSGQFFFRGE